MLNSSDHEISTAHKNQNAEYKEFLALNLTDVVFIMLIFVKMPTIIGILTLMSMIKFHAQLSWAWKSFITSVPDH